MNQIKFSHCDYNKFAKVNTHRPVILMEVFSKERTEMHKTFIEYDTTRANGEAYTLSKGKHLVLLFRDKTGNIFTTVRPWKPEKEQFYKNKRGKEFRVVFT